MGMERKAQLKKVLQLSGVFVVLTLCLFFPVYESAGCAELQLAVSSNEKRISSLFDQIDLETARIAQAATPEFLVWSSGNLSKGLMKIEPEKNFFVEEEALK